jgi:predicted TIM-barrel fold metal-dependent hydrolase
MIVDAHAHCGKWYFPSFCEKPEDVSKLCDRHGIDRIVFSSSLAILYDMESGNRQTAEFIGNDERFYGYVYLNPAEPEASAREIDRYAGREDFVGAKLHPSYSGRSIGDPETLALLEDVPEDLVILIHTWGPSSVGHLCQLAGQLPRLSFLMGHMGGTATDDWQAGIKGAERSPNVFLEICGSHLEYDRIGRATAALGSRRILFGSDTTLINPAFSIGQILGSAASEKEKKDMLGRNALRLFSFS